MTTLRPNSTDLAPGTQVADYVIEALLGQGAQGSVYLARDALLGRRVALKTLRSGTQDETRGVEEARLLAALEHPNLVRVYHAMRHHGTWFIVSEYLGGGSLQQLVQRQSKLEPSQALDLLAQGARGLAFIHAQGVVHRDVKPENLLLSAAGEVKLADFGLAQLTSAERRSVSAQVGTPAFRAPELLQGAAANAATDVYSLGATLYYLLTGRIPFVSLMDSGAARVERDLPMPEELTAPIKRLLVKLLCAVPGERPRSSELPELLARLALEPSRDLRLAPAAPSIPDPLCDVGSTAVTRQVLQQGPDGVALANFLATDAVRQGVVLLTGESSDHLWEFAATALARDGRLPFVASRTLLRSSSATLPIQWSRGGRLSVEAVADLLREGRASAAREQRFQYVEVQLLTAPSPRQWQDVLELATSARQAGLACWILGPELPQSSNLADHLVRFSLRDQTDQSQVYQARLSAWLRFATQDRLRFTADGLRYAAHLCATDQVFWGQLAHHCVLVAVHARLPVVTSWVVWGAWQSGDSLRQLAEVPAAFRTPPTEWPPSEHLATLQELRSGSAAEPHWVSLVSAGHG